MLIDDIGFRRQPPGGALGFAQHVDRVRHPHQTVDVAAGGIGARRLVQTFTDLLDASAPAVAFSIGRIEQPQRPVSTATEMMRLGGGSKDRSRASSASGTIPVSFRSASTCSALAACISFFVGEVRPSPAMLTGV